MPQKEPVNMSNDLAIFCMGVIVMVIFVVLFSGLQLQAMLAEQHVNELQEKLPEAKVDHETFDYERQRGKRQYNLDEFEWERGHSPEGAHSPYHGSNE